MSNGTAGPDDDPFADWTVAGSPHPDDTPATAPGTDAFRDWTAVPKQPPAASSGVPSVAETNQLYGSALINAIPELRQALQPDPSHTYSELLPWAWATPDKSDPGWPSLPQVVRDMFTAALNPTKPSGAFYQPGEGSNLYSGEITPAGQAVLSLGARPFGGPAAIPDTTEAPPAKLPPPYPTYPNPPETSAAAKEIASLYYKAGDRLGAQMSPSFSNDVLDIAGKVGPQSLGEKLTIGSNDLTDMLQRWEQFRDKPMSFQDIQGMDESLGKLISKNYSSDPGTARDLMNLQSQLRARVLNVSPNDLTAGSPAAFYALQQGRAAYSQAMKMADLEEIGRRAQVVGTAGGNEDAAIKSQLVSLLKDQAKTRGYSDDEMAAVQDATKSGALNKLKGIVGSKLLGAVAGSSHGPIGTVIGTGAAEFAGGALGALAANARQKMLADAIRQIGMGVPVNPLAQP